MKIKFLPRQERGSTLVEYCFLASLLTIASLGAVSSVGNYTGATFANLGSGFLASGGDAGRGSASVGDGFSAVNTGGGSFGTGDHDYLDNQDQGGPNNGN